jgi:hypothetical protein
MTTRKNLGLILAGAAMSAAAITVVATNDPDPSTTSLGTTVITITPTTKATARTPWRTVVTLNPPPPPTRQPLSTPPKGENP